MTTALGYKAYFGFGTEGTWGGGTTSSNFLEMNPGGGITLAEEHLNANSIRNVWRDKANMKRGYITAGADLSFDARYGGWEKILKYALGTAVTTQPEGTSVANYQHVFSLTDDPFGGMSFNVCEDLNVFRLEGGMINTLTLQMNNTGFLTCSINVVGEDVGTQSTETPSFPTQPLIVFNEGTFSWSGTTYNCQDFSVTLNNALNVNRRFIGSRIISQPMRDGKVEVTGSFTLEFEGLAQYNNFRSATAAAILLSCTGGTTGTGTSSYTLTISMPNVLLTGAIPTTSNEGRIMLPCNFKAYAASGTERELTVTLINGVATV